MQSSPRHLLTAGEIGQIEKVDGELAAVALEGTSRPPNRAESQIGAVVRLPFDERLAFPIRSQPHSP